MPDDEPDPAQPPAAPGAAAPEPPRPAPAGAEALPQPRIVETRRWNVSLVWLLPAVAVAIGASLLVRSVFLIGPRIDIEFASAEGVEAGKTEVRYKEVVIGKVQSVTLRDDRNGRRRRRPARALGGRLRGPGHHLLGRQAAHRLRRRHRSRHAALRQPTSAPTPASRPRRGAGSRDSRRRRSCSAASPAGSSSCAPSTSARSTSARRCSIAAPGSAGSSATPSTRSATSSRCGSSSRHRTSSSSARTRASGMRAASICPSMPAA